MYSIFDDFFKFLILLSFLYVDDEEGKEYRSRGSRELSSQSESERIDERCSASMFSSFSSLDAFDNSEDDSEDDILNLFFSLSLLLFACFLKSQNKNYSIF